MAEVKSAFGAELMHLKEALGKAKEELALERKRRSSTPYGITFPIARTRTRCIPNRNGKTHELERKREGEEREEEKERGGRKGEEEEERASNSHQRPSDILLRVHPYSAWEEGKLMEAILSSSDVVHPRLKIIGRRRIRIGVGIGIGLKTSNSLR
ncbi:hypothetical protein COCNU_06G019790 [Cocos nucifera]|uniref:Uncharacterized protein n=1 Tax=Cocos nucifera TaxID=13894 RepID=A0A8K0IDQ1_COCNU|nr:hypothetical protein COCNU_06G019790 [Cocos nucifera]